jgi:hypothetical protein
MAATPDLWHHLGDDMQLWRVVPAEPPGVPYDPAGETPRILITRHATAETADYPALLVDGGFEFAPADAAVIASGGAYSVRFRSSEGGLDLTFPNAAPLLAWVT